MHYLIAVGILLAISGIILIYFLKRPLNTSDKLVIFILSCFTVKFSLEETSLITGQITWDVHAAIFGMSTILSCAWYIKYLTKTDRSFGRKEFASYLPLLVFLVLETIGFFFFYSSPGYVSCLLLVILLFVLYYFYVCIITLRRHQQLIRDNYSGEPGSITVNWMKAIIGLQIAEFVIKIVLSDKLTRLSGVNLSIVSNTFCFILETFLLVVFCIWQKSIPLFIPASELSEEVIQSTEILQHYFRKLEQFMAEQKPYLDPELTIEKLSIQVNIRKAMLSQVLNKGINKNFFTFIREYRVQHAIQLLQLAGQHQTIIVIAYESGFNSKTAFHRAFKEVTGKTPSEFQQLSD